MHGPMNVKLEINLILTWPLAKENLILYIALKDSNRKYQVLCLAVESTVAATLYAYHPHYYLTFWHRSFTFKF